MNDKRPSDLAGLSLREAADLLRSRKASPVDLTRACLARVETYDKTLNAFIALTAESALAEARAAEAEIQGGRWRGPLHGIPIALKDLVDVAGVPTTAASKVLASNTPARDAFVVSRLKAAGAVLLGKLNMHEFAYGASTVVSAYGPVKNPWATSYSAGGSSAGSAAAVAAGLCYGSVGSDTGGSIRQPAAFCALVGLKPTYGRVSTRGAVPLSWSLDHLGPMTRRVFDAAVMLRVLAGYDALDQASADVEVPDYAGGLGNTAGLRVGIPRSPFYEGLHPEVEAAVAAALGVMKGITASQDEVVLETGVEDSMPILRAEAYAFHEPHVARSAELYQPATLERIRAGAEITAAAYIAARRRLLDLRRTVVSVFDRVDVLITPTTPVPPHEIADLQARPAELRPWEILTLRNVRPFNALGLPSISVPCGFTSAGLPIGVQITGPPWSEGRILALAHAYERATDWHRRAPRLPAS